MSNKFDDLTRKQNMPKRQIQEIDGCFSCQTCDEVVEVAQLHDEVLIWKCSKGHSSKIKGFQL